jgi:AcrR family transcriptional regulator
MSAPPLDSEALAAPAPAAAVDLPADGREAQLLAIARRLFAQKGYDATSLRDIAEEARITKAALYYYFPNKDTLYERIVIESMASLLAEVQAAVGRVRTPTERVRAFLRASAESMDQRRDQWMAGSNAFWQAGATGRRGLALQHRDDYERLLPGDRRPVATLRPQPDVALAPAERRTARDRSHRPVPRHRAAGPDQPWRAHSGATAGPAVLNPRRDA